MSDEILRSSIPPDLEKLLGLRSKSKQQAEVFMQAFIVSSMPTVTEESLDVLKHKALILEYARSKGTKTRTKRAKGLSAKLRRELKLFHIKPEQQRYKLFLPLHDLWKQYILSICNGLKPGSSSPQLLQQKLLKADLHGAVITVVRSKCPSYVGTTGILLQEFKHVFKIITTDDRLKVIPKRNSVFSVEINGFVSHIYGNKFEYRASERSAKKFKAQGSMDL